MKPARPLDRFPLVQSQNADEVCAALARVYAKPTLHLEGSGKQIDATFNLYQMKDVGLGYTRYGMPISVVYPESDSTMQTLPIRGQGEATVDRVVGALDPHHGMTVSPGASVSVRLNANYEHFILLMNTRALVEKLRAITGASIDRRLSFHAMRDDTRPAAKALRDHFAFLVDKVSRSLAPLPKMMLAEFEQTLMVMFLHANQHNYSDLLAQASPDPAPQQVRRAEEYIEANWQHAVALEDLARASGVSALSLFRAFKKSRGYSPFEFANRVRLRRARSLLQRPGAATTVAEVAASCGFADVGCFADDYARAFGEPPSRTLGRSRHDGFF